MRYICHINGCDLVFGSVREKLPSQLFKAQISRHVFNDNTLQVKIERDPNQPINMYSGADSFIQIGEPEGASMRGKVSFDKLWQEIVETNFQKQQVDQSGVGGLGDMKKFTEDKVDKMRKQKDEELENYKKELERAKRFENQKGAGGAG